MIINPFLLAAQYLGEKAMIERIARALFANEEKWKDVYFYHAPMHIQRLFRLDAKVALAEYRAAMLEPEAVERALNMHHDLTHPDTGWTRQDAMKAALAAAMETK
jgi:hypothetical protein